MLEIWELITGRKQHKTGKDGGDFLWKPRPDKGCSATDDDMFSFHTANCTKRHDFSYFSSNYFSISMTMSFPSLKHPIYWLFRPNLPSQIN
jgi:hypothetical protein